MSGGYESNQLKALGYFRLTRESSASRQDDLVTIGATWRKSPSRDGNMLELQMIIRLDAAVGGVFPSSPRTGGLARRKSRLLSSTSTRRRGANCAPNTPEATEIIRRIRDLRRSGKLGMDARVGSVVPPKVPLMTGFARACRVGSVATLGRLWRPDSRAAENSGGRSPALLGGAKRSGWSVACG